MEFLPDGGHAVACESGETMQRRPRRNHTPAFKAKWRLPPSSAIERWLNWWSSLTSRFEASLPDAHDCIMVRALDLPDARLWRD